MFYFIYQIQNTVNGKIYVGVHRTEDLNDGYMGSGKLLKQAIMKYGVESFTKTILEFFPSYEVALQREKELVTEEFVSRRDVYNVRVGGLGGWDYVVGQGLHKNATGKVAWNKGLEMGPPSEESNKKRSETLKKHWTENQHPRKGKGSWLSGTKGLIEPWNKGKAMNKTPCPHCGKEVDTLNMKRWHGEKCKERGQAGNAAVC